MPKCNGRSGDSLKFEFVPMSHGLHIRIDNNNDPSLWVEIDLSLVELLRWCAKIKQLDIAADEKRAANLIPEDDGSYSAYRHRYPRKPE